MEHFQRRERTEPSQTLDQASAGCQALLNAVEAIKEGGIAWNSLVSAVKEDEVKWKRKLKCKRKGETMSPVLTKVNSPELNTSHFELVII